MVTVPIILITIEYIAIRKCKLLYVHADDDNDATIIATKAFLLMRGNLKCLWLRKTIKIYIETRILKCTHLSVCIAARVCALCNLKFKTFIIVISFIKTPFGVASGTKQSCITILLFVCIYMWLGERIRRARAVLLRDWDFNGLALVLVSVELMVALHLRQKSF